MRAPPDGESGRGASHGGGSGLVVAAESRGAGMTAVRRLLWPVALLVLLAGAVVLLAPVSVADGDGGSIGCGNAVAADFSAALDANAESVATAVIAGQVGPHTNYVAGCRSSVATRRAWALALVFIGAIGAAVGFTT